MPPLQCERAVPAAEARCLCYIAGASLGSPFQKQIQNDLFLLSNDITIINIIKASVRAKIIMISNNIIMKRE